MSLRCSTPADDVAGLIRAAFGDEGDQVAAIWVDLEREGLVLGSLVAEVDGAVAGHVGLSPAWLDTRRELLDVWLLSPLGVLPDHQGDGLGTRLVEAAAVAAAAGGAPMLFVEGSPTWYGSRGFEPARPLGLLPPTDRVPGPAFQVVRLDGYRPWMTGRLVYRDVWWRHDAAGLRDPLLAELEKEYE
jgi:putative acetyltransferase